MVNKNEVAGLVADEIVNLIDEDELTRIETAAISNYSETEQVFVTDRQQAFLTHLRHPNWKHRREALQQIYLRLLTIFMVAIAKSRLIAPPPRLRLMY